MADTKEVTRKSTLLECLEYERDLWKLCSEKYNMLTPMKGMEDLFQQQKEKCRILQELIQGLESESVRAALAGWQKDVMQNGPTALQLDGPEAKAIL